MGQIIPGEIVIPGSIPRRRWGGMETKDFRAFLEIAEEENRKFWARKGTFSGFWMSTFKSVCDAG